VRTKGAAGRRAAAKKAARTKPKQKQEGAIAAERLYI
jgi:hypothetical protein